MEDLEVRLWHDLWERVTGPMSFRLLLQPTVASFFGVRAGLRLARRECNSSRTEMFQEALIDVGKMFVFGVVLDVAFQLWVLKTVFAGEAILAGAVLVALPYRLVRDLTRFTVRRRVRQAKN